MKKQKELRVGDVVVVKEGVMCPDRESQSLAGWQGRVEDLYTGDEGIPMVFLQWDSITLRALPEDYLQESMREGLDWSRMGMAAEEVEWAEPRDTEADVQGARDENEAHYYWYFLDEEGPRIQQVLDGIPPRDLMACLEAWEKHLQKALSFPFEAEVFEYQEEGPLDTGDRVRVHRISLVDDHYGIIVDVRLGRRKYAFPLCDLEVVPKKSPNFQRLKDYCVWFANR